METLKKIGKVCFFLVAFVGLVVTAVFGYYKINHNVISMVTYNISDQIPIDLAEKSDDLTDEEIEEYESRVLFNVNYYSNDKENGLELQEMRLDYFTDLSLGVNACRSTGMQYIGDFQNYIVDVNSESEANKYIPNDFYYYDTTNMISWSGGKVATQLNRNSVLIIKIDNKPFSLQLTGKYDIYGPLFGFLWNVKLSTNYYDYGTVFQDVMNAVKSNSNGYGDYYITLDLSNYFTIYEYVDGKFDSSEQADIIKNYAVLKFHYDENGARNSSQSMFNSIQCNASYDVNDVTINTEYWQERILYNLNNHDLTLRYSEVYDGYFVSLPIETKTLFSKMGRTKVNVNIDMDYNGKNIVGIDYNGFENFEIDTITINGSGTFNILDNGLKNSKLQNLRYTNGITLNIATNAINNEYEGVAI